MATIKRFEDILVWQKAQDLTVQLYQLFELSKDFAFRDQICRAAVSISNNIAEGFERDTTKDFIRFLYMARGSSGEVRSMLYLAKRLNYIDIKTFDRLKSQAEEISKMVKGFINSIKPSH